MPELETRISTHFEDVRAIARALGRADLINGARLHMSAATRHDISALLDGDGASLFVRTPDRNDRLAFQLVFAFMEVADDTMLVIRRRPGGYLCLKQIYGGSLAHGTDVWSTLVPLPRAMAAKPLRIKLFNR